MDLTFNEMDEAAALVLARSLQGKPRLRSVALEGNALGPRARSAIKELGGAEGSGEDIIIIGSTELSFQFTRRHASDRRVIESEPRRARARRPVDASARAGRGR